MCVRLFLNLFYYLFFLEFERSDTSLKQHKVSLGVKSSLLPAAPRWGRFGRLNATIGEYKCSCFMPPAFASSPFDARLRDSNARSVAVSHFFQDEVCMAKRFSVPPPVQLNCLIHGTS